MRKLIGIALAVCAAVRVLGQTAQTPPVPSAPATTAEVEALREQVQSLKEMVQALQKQVQEQQAPQKKFADSYLQLSKLHLKSGKSADAKQDLENGLRLFPDDAELKKALDAAK